MGTYDEKDQLIGQMLDTRLGIHQHRRDPIVLHLDSLALIRGHHYRVLNLIDLLAREIIRSHVFQLVQIVLQQLIRPLVELDLFGMLLLDVLERLRGLLL